MFMMMMMMMMMMLVSLTTKKKTNCTSSVGCCRFLYVFVDKDRTAAMTRDMFKDIVENLNPYDKIRYDACVDGCMCGWMNEWIR